MTQTDAAAEHPESRGERAPTDGPRRGARRAMTPPPPGSDPAPSPEPARHRLDENDDRLTADKPPHY